MKRQVTARDLVQPKLSKEAKAVFMDALKAAQKEQNELLKKARKLG